MGKSLFNIQRKRRTGDGDDGRKMEPKKWHKHRTVHRGLQKLKSKLF